MKNLVMIMLFAFCMQVYSQVTISTNTSATPDASAILDVQSTDKGVLLPRLTTAQRDGISSPAPGLLIYNSDDACLQYYDGANWSQCLGHASNTLKCGTESVSGTYYTGYALDASHTITIDVEVYQTGTYTISTNTVNGYSFSTSETFNTIGVYTVTLDGSGTPSSEETDNFIISLQGSSNTCSVNVQVVDVKPSCKQYLNAGYTDDGIYRIDPDGSGGNAPVDCYCDMNTDGGGWTLVASSKGAIDDKAISYHNELQTLSPSNLNNGLWDGMRDVISGGNCDIRFSANQNGGATFDVDLAFYANTWYSVLTSDADDANVCFNENNGNGQISEPERKNILTGDTRASGDQWDYGYLESEDSCGDTGDFTVDFDDRGMDSDQEDGTDWGEDDNTQKCGSVSGGTYYYFIWVRE